MRRFSAAGVRLASMALLSAVCLFAVSIQLAFAQYRDRERSEPGDFDYYTLVLSWSPTHCQFSENYGRGNSRQCNGDKSHAFVLHGLWPQFWKGWPEFCRTRRREWVPNELIEDLDDVMPDKGLVIHQYRKHGTCSGMPPAEYFGLARSLYESVQIPKQFRQPDRPLSLSPDDVEAAFLEANPQLKPEMMAVSCRNNLVQEVRVCFGRDRKPSACGRNEDQARLCRTGRITLPPVRWRAPSGI